MKSDRAFTLDMVGRLAIAAGLLLGVSVVQGAPRIAVNEPRFDFGEAMATDVIHHTFAMTNEGDEPLVIQAFKPACHCTVTSDQRMTIAPGATSAVEVSLSLKGSSGRVHKRVVVESNDPVTPTLDLWMVGMVRSPVTVVPERVSFGSVVDMAPLHATVDIDIDSASPRRLTGATTSSDQVSARLETLTEGGRYRLHVFLDPAQATGRIREQVWIATDSEDLPLVTVPVDAKVVGAFSVSPEEVLLTADAVRPVVTRHILVGPGHVKTFKITDVTLPDAAIIKKIDAIGERGYRIRLSNMSSDPALDGRVIVIHTDSSMSPELRIPIRVIGAPRSEPDEGAIINSHD